MNNSKHSDLCYSRQPAPCHEQTTTDHLRMQWTSKEAFTRDVRQRQEQHQGLGLGLLPTNNLYLHLLYLKQPH